MPTKNIYIENNSREIILKGVNIVAEPTKKTLGAKGKNVVIGNKITKDGISVVKAINVKDEEDAIGANIIKQASERTLKEAGDGTTSAVIICQSIIVEGFKLLAAGMNGQDLKSGIDKATKVIVEEIKSMSIKIDVHSPKLKHIATIAANGDEEIGELITEAFIKTGKDGVRSLENSNTGASYLETKDGLFFESGYIMQVYINNQENQSCVLEDAFIIICEGKITTLKEINPILQKINLEFKKPENTKKGILFIAEEFEGEALYTLNVNRAKNNFPICIVKAPGFGDNKKNLLKDIASVVGADIANEESGIRPDTLKIENLGYASKVTITKDETIIVGGGGKKHDIDERIAFVRKSIELIPANDVYHKEQLERSLAKLTGGVAVIYVGAATEVELNEKKDRFDDSRRATECALQEGIVAGGGVALIRCIDSLNKIECKTEDEKAGVKLIQKVLVAPFLQMAKNAGIELAVKDLKSDNKNYGYNFKTDTFEDLFESGVVDAAKVVRVSFVNAASVAGTLLTTDAVIVQVNQEMPYIPPQMRNL